MNTQRKAPTWATVVGILGICFGALGMLGGSYELMMPMMMSMQKQMMQGMKESIQEAPQDPCPNGAEQSPQQVDPDAAFAAMEEFMSYPAWYKRFAFVNGGLQLVLAALYVLSSIFLLLLKQGAPTFFVSVAALSAVRNLVAAGVGLSAGSFFAFWSVASGAVGFLMDLVLIIVVMVSDRSPYARAAVS